MANDDSPTPTVCINWGQYGEYELLLDASGEQMAGAAKGAPDNWRRAVRVRSLGQQPEAHIHDH